AVACQTLGSADEADDAVQEAWLRLSRTDPDEIENLGGWLHTLAPAERLAFVLHDMFTVPVDDTGASWALPRRGPPPLARRAGRRVQGVAAVTCTPGMTWRSRRTGSAMPSTGSARSAQPAETPGSPPGPLLSVIALPAWPWDGSWTGCRGISGRSEHCERTRVTISAGRTPGARGRAYGKEKVYGSIP